MTTPLDQLRAENERLKAELTRLHRENDDLRKRLRRSNEALDHLAGYAAPE